MDPTLARDLWMRLDPFLAGSAAKTLLLGAAIFILRLAISRALDRASGLGEPEDRRRWKVALRNVSLLVMLVGSVLIWAAELQTLMLSVVAFAAAMVLAFKEVINCVSGTFVRTATGVFAIGDRVEIAGVRGDVVDYTLLSTTLMEVGPGQQTQQYTGRAVVLPNSLLLSGPVFNESFTDEYALHHFTVAIPRDGDWKTAEHALLSAASAESVDYIEAARTFLEGEARRRSLETVNIDPRVHLRLGDPSRIEFVVRLAVPTRKKGRIEQAILRRFLEATAG